MRVVDEETLHAADLETKAPEDQEAAKAVDDPPSSPRTKKAPHRHLLLWSERLAQSLSSSDLRRKRNSYP